MNLFSFVEDWPSSDSTESSEPNEGVFRSFRNGSRVTLCSSRRTGNRLYEIEKGLYSNNPNLKLGSWKKIIWRVVLLIMSLFFFAAAYVQHNDPDPYLWIAVYIVPMCVNVNLMISLPLGNWSLLNKLITCHLAYCYTLGFWTLAYFIHGLLSTSGGYDTFREPKMFAEEAKELLGLCLVIAWLSFMSSGKFLRFGWKSIIFAVTLTGAPILCWIFLEELEGEIQECL